MSVLLVEDEPAVRQTVASYLEDLGLFVWEAANAEDALILLRSPNCHVTTLVTDINLGPGESGVALAKKAKQHLPDLQVVYETGSPEVFDGRLLADWEMLFLKPYNMSSLAACVFALEQQRPLRYRQLRSSHSPQSVILG